MKVALLHLHGDIMRLPFSPVIHPWHENLVDEPKLISEFIIQYMHKDRNELLPVLEDKYASREYVKSKNACNVINLFHWTEKKPIRLPWEKLPQRCVIKTNHWSGDGIFIIDNGEEPIGGVKKDMAIQEIYRVIRNNKDQDGNKWSNRKIERKLTRLVKKHYPFLYEWAVRNIDPRGVLVEELLLNKKGEIPDDIKVHCFSGKAGFIQYERGKFTSVRQNLHHPITGEVITQTENLKWPGIEEITNLKDELGEDFFNNIVCAAEKLSEDVPYVRVDLFLVDSEIYFGEFTLYPRSGQKQSKEWEELGGKLWKEGLEIS
jgi:hypothetical protein